jgi:class 3 adenylate cyclase
VACAAAITEGLAEIGLVVRAGVHTGEVEVRDGEIGGLGVHIASRVMSHAERGGIVVSSTGKDLVVGSGIEFAPCGAVELRGVPGSWQLYEFKAA